MTPTQIKIALWGGAALLAWLFTTRKSAPTGSVDLGIPTIDGVYGGGRLGNGVDYFSTPSYVAGPGGPGYATPSPANPALDPRMRDLIDRSNAAIAQDDLINGIE